MLREPFMQRALFEAAILTVLCVVTGVVVLLRKQAFVTDALSHTVFPGLAIGVALGHQVVLGAFIAAAVATALLSLLARVRRLDSDSVLAVLIASFVAVGVAVVSRRPSFQSDLDVLLFGHLLTVNRGLIVETAIVAAVVVAAVAAVAKELLLVAFDAESAAAQGYRVGLIALGLNAAVAATVVVAAQAAGAALAVPMIVLPAAIARTMTDRVGRIAVVALAAGLTCSLGGLALSYQLSVGHDVRLGPSALITVLMTLLFASGMVVRKVRA